MNIITKNYFLNNFLKKKLFKKFINNLTLKGKKNINEKIFIKTFYKLKKLKKNPIKIFIKAIENGKPIVSIVVRKKRKFSRTIPFALNSFKQIKLSIKTIIMETRNINKSKTNFNQALIIELLNLNKNKGSIILKKQQLYQTASLNKAFVRFLKK
jgi:ribosomal protein S7